MPDALTRELVVRTARAQLEAGGGVEQLSLRAVARELGVTAPALYAYVQDKRELLAAVAAAHFERLVERFEAIDEPDPLDRIRAVSRAYVAHAVASPALFPLLFRYPPAPIPESDAFPPATRAFEVALEATAAAVDQGLLAVTDVNLAAMTMWAGVHGVAEIVLMGFGLDETGTEALLGSVIETVLAGQITPLP